MSKFWTGVGILLLVGLIAVFAAGSTSRLKVNDLETECRVSHNEQTNIQLQQDNSISFKGHFPVENTNSDMSYRYRKGNNIVLNVRSQNMPMPASFWNNCLASGVYDFETRSLEPGRYAVTVKHNGERVEKRIIRVE